VILILTKRQAHCGRAKTAKSGAKRAKMALTTFKKRTLIQDNTVFRFFFGLIILAYNLSRSWRRTFCPVFLSAVRAVTARCKLPLCPPPGPPEKLLRTKEIDEGKDRRKPLPIPLLLPRRCHEGWGGQEQRLLPRTQLLHLHPAHLFPLPALPKLPFQHLTPYVRFPSRRQDYSSHVCCCEKV